MRKCRFLIRGGLLRQRLRLSVSFQKKSKPSLSSEGSSRRFGYGRQERSRNWTLSSACYVEPCVAIWVQNKSPGCCSVSASSVRSRPPSHRIASCYLKFWHNGLPQSYGIVVFGPTFPRYFTVPFYKPTASSSLLLANVLHPIRATS